MGGKERKGRQTLPKGRTRRKIFGHGLTGGRRLTPLRLQGGQGTAPPTREGQGGRETQHNSDYRSTKETDNPRMLC